MQFGRTENIKNTLNPEFATTFEVDYYFEEVQHVKLQVYDLDNKSADLSDDDYLGGIECTLGQVRVRQRALSVRWDALYCVYCAACVWRSVVMCVCR